NITVISVRHPADVAVFTDAAQVNTFQAPASPSHPMLEECYYVSVNPREATVHFRHQQRANVVFFDGHVARETPQPNSIDPAWPQQYVGRLREECLRP